MIEDCVLSPRLALNQTYSKMTKPLTLFIFHHESKDILLFMLHCDFVKATLLTRKWNKCLISFIVFPLGYLLPSSLMFEVAKWPPLFPLTPIGSIYFLPCFSAMLLKMNSSAELTKLEIMCTGIHFQKGRRHVWWDKGY